MNLKDKLNDIIKNSIGDISIVYRDLNSNTSIEINEDKIFPSASTIKILIMATVMRKIKYENLNINFKLKLTKDFQCGGSGMLSELDSDHMFSVRELITAMIIQSDNAATNMLIDLVTIEKINEMASELNMNNTILKRKMMDFQAAKEGKENITTTKDLAIILEGIYRGTVVDMKSSEFMLSILKRQQLEGGIGRYLPENATIANKTGELDKIEHDAGIIYHPKGDYVLCVLTKDVENNKVGRDIIGRISREIYNN